MSTLKVDTVRPVTTDGSLTLQGDSSGSGVTGITIDSSGDTTLGGNLVIPDDGTIGSASATGAITIASDGQVTIDNLTGIPVFKVTLSTNQSTTSAVETKLALSNELIDTHNFFDASTNYRFQPTIAGYYKFDATVFVLGTPIRFYLVFYKNGSPVNQGGCDFSGGYYSNGVVGSTIIELNGSTDYVELYALQTSATGFYNVGSLNSYLTGYLISGT